MGYRHTRDDILAGAVAVAFADGLSRLTFGRVAKHLGISDRTVVYYFPTKDDLIGDVLIGLGTHLQATLAPAFADRAPDHLTLASSAWPILARPDADPVFALFFEAVGLAATGRPPYDEIVPSLIEAWLAWIEVHLDVPPDRRRPQAEAVIAVLDGLLLLRQIGGSEAADRAAHQLGLVPRD